jgi:DNA polymerase III subunit delta
VAGPTRRRASPAEQRGGVFLLEGDDDFLKEEAARRIVQAHVDPATQDFNLDTLRGTSVDPETLLSICFTPPMMAEWRVVIVRDAHALAANARMRSAVQTLLKKPVPGLAVLLLAQLPERGRAKLWDEVARKATVIRVSPPSAAELPDWLIDRAAADGLTIEPAAARALAAAIGASLGVLVQELEKLRGYVGERAHVTRADVEALVGHVPRVNRWDWFDAVGDGRLDQARRDLPALFDSGESGVGLLIGLGAQFLRLGVGAAGGERALAEALPPHQRWLARRLFKQARRWSPDDIDAVLDDLLRADRLLKSASLTDRQVMEELLLRLHQRATKAA